MATTFPPRTFWRIGFASLTALPLLFASSLAGAESPAEQNGFAVNRFDPAEKGSDWFVAESLDFRGKFRPALGVVGEWATKEIVFYNFDDSTQARFIEHQAYFHLGGSLVLWDRLRVGASLPLAIYQTGESTRVNGAILTAPEKAAVGDLRIGGDVRLFGAYREAIEGALGVQVHLPTGSQNLFTGDGSTRVVPRLMLAGDLGDFAYALRGGYELRGRAEPFGGRLFGDEITGSLAIGVRAFEKKLLIGPEFYGSTLASGAFKEKTTPSEILFGAHYTCHDLKLGAGFGSGLTRAFGSPQLRVILGVEWTPALEEPTKSDRDSDTIADPDDKCPDTPGVVSETNHGCPPPAAPPPPDRDADGVIDTDDACPDVAGVKTMDPKTSGCPAVAPVAKVADRDGDGVPDSADACPGVAGVADADPKKNGCPVTAAKVLPVVSDQIKITHQVNFKFGSAELLKESDAGLSGVAETLKQHPEIARVQVEGYTDNKGNPETNRLLSQKRAESVVTWMTAHGIAKSRLEAKGFGDEKPLDTNATEAGRANNRRVEFHIEKN